MFNVISEWDGIPSEEASVVIDEMKKLKYLKNPSRLNCAMILVHKRNFRFLST